MIDVSEVVNDPDLAQPFSILRSSGSWFKGVWNSVQTTVQGYGVISVAEAQDLEMVSEGDIVHGAMVFHSQQPIFRTNANNATDSTGGSADILVWRGENYRVLHVYPYEDYGYYRAVAVRMLTD